MNLFALKDGGDNSSKYNTHSCNLLSVSLLVFSPSLFFFFLLLLSLSPSSPSPLPPSSLRAVTLQLTEEKAKESEGEREGGSQLDKVMMR